MKTTAFAAALVAAGLFAPPSVAFAQADHPTVPKAGMSHATKMAAQDKTAPTRYVREAALSDMFEVAAGKLAITRARSNDVKDFARMMVKDHTESTKMLKDAIEQSKIGIKPPTKLDAAHQKKLDQLKSVKDANFDRRYMDMQVKAHTLALSLHQDYAVKGKVEPLKDAAGKIADTVKHHLEVAREVASKVATPSTSNTNPTTGLPRKGA
jgi:putative membrane protein